MKYFLYKTILLIFPSHLINFLKNTAIFKPIKDWLFGKNRDLKSSAFIEWNGFKFYFFAHPKVLLRASKYGIESSLTRAMLKIIKPCSNVIDIGSNYGFIAMVLGSYINKPGGTLFSFECNKEVYINLQASIKKNDLTNIKTYNLFLGAKDEGDIHTVDKILKDKMVDINLIKIDTDGSDLDCLKGCSKIIDKNHPIIVIEINNNLENIIKYLSEMEYKFFYNQFFKCINNEMLNLTEVPNLIASVTDLKIKLS